MSKDRKEHSYRQAPVGRIVWGIANDVWKETQWAGTVVPHPAGTPDLVQGKRGIISQMLSDFERWKK